MWAPGSGKQIAIACTLSLQHIDLSCARPASLPLTGASHPSSSPSGPAHVRMKQVHNLSDSVDQQHSLPADAEPHHNRQQQQHGHDPGRQQPQILGSGGLGVVRRAASSLVHHRPEVAAEAGPWSPLGHCFASRSMSDATAKRPELVPNAGSEGVPAIWTDQQDSGCPKYVNQACRDRAKLPGIKMAANRLVKECSLPTTDGAGGTLKV